MKLKAWINLATAHKQALEARSRMQKAGYTLCRIVASLGPDNGPCTLEVLADFLQSLAGLGELHDEKLERLYKAIDALRGKK